MPKCKDCAWLEMSKYFGANRGTCIEDLKKTKSIPDFEKKIECKKFVQKRSGLTHVDMHAWKDRHITTRRNFLMAALALSVSVISLLASAIPLYLTSVQPAVILAVEDMPARVVGPVNSTLQSSFVLYNKGSEICFLEQMQMYWAHENGTLEIFQSVNLDRQLISPGETLEMSFDIQPFDDESVSKDFIIVVFYGSGRYVRSPVSNAYWYV